MNQPTASTTATATAAPATAAAAAATSSMEAAPVASSSGAAEKPKVSRVPVKNNDRFVENSCGAPLAWPGGCARGAGTGPWHAGRGPGAAGNPEGRRGGVGSGPANSGGAR